MQCVVLKSFGGPDGIEFLPGELVDASKFRHAEKLIEQRRLRLATPDEIASAVEIEDAGAGPVRRDPPPLKAKTKKGRK